MLPKDTKDSIDRYVDHGVRTGDFLFAVLSNDLFEAVIRADSTNILCIVDICRYIYNYTPQCCHGSIEKVNAWLALHKENSTDAQGIAQFDAVRRKNFKQ